MQKITLISGGSRGIGRATALCLAKKGHDIAISYHEKKGAALDVVHHIEALGRRAIATPVNLANEEDIIDWFKIVETQLGRITGLVNNAAILMPQCPIEAMAVDRIQQILLINVMGSFICAREAVKRMAFQHGGLGGNIVNVSSAAARLGSPHEYLDYAASKGAIDTFTKGLSLEVATQGIRVNAVRPGFIYTDMHADGGEPERVNRIKSSLPMQRGGQPEEVAEAIAWLLSDEASYVTGSFIDVSGGR